MKRGINKKNNNSYKQNIKKSRILRNIIITVAIILLIGALFISYKGITGNVVGDESGVYTGDSVGVYMAPTSQFYLKNNLNDLDGIIKIFSFNKLHYPKDMTWCTNDFKKDFGTCFFKPQNNNNCRFIKPVDKEFTYAGMSYKSQIPLMGDWDGDGIDSAGIYNVIDGEFILKNSNTAGKGDLKFKYGKKALEQFSKDYKDVYGRIKYYPYALQYPLVGDWDGDGLDSI